MFKANIIVVHCVLGILASAMLVGCRNSSLKIAGSVCTGPEYIASFVTGGGDAISEGHFPVGEAVVFIAQIQNADVPIDGFQTKSKVDGSYSISLDGLPPSTAENKEYYLIVKKDGFETAKVSFGTGRLSKYLRNTVVLQKSKDAGKKVPE